MSKNIIICCDGTGNQFGEANSNVVKLFSVLDKNDPNQIAYYDPGVGTMTESLLKVTLGQRFQIMQGLAFGYGLAENVEQAYQFLMENYEKGDKVYLFGFSRGAYTVRALAGFIFSCGLLPKGAANLIPYAWNIYRDFEKNKKFATKFKNTYARECRFHYMGIWDTVSSIGIFSVKKSLPYTANNPIIRNIRHALSIDERRAYYKANLLGRKYEKFQNIKEVWFVGVHSDVGGSYPEEESQLSKISLKWLVNESVNFGLLIDKGQYNKVVLGRKSTRAKYTFAKPNPLGKLHKSLTNGWWILEYFPRRYPMKKRKFYIPNGRRRTIPKDAFIHESVLERLNNEDIQYKPENLPPIDGLCLVSDPSIKKEKEKESGTA